MKFLWILPCKQWFLRRTRIHCEQTNGFLSSTIKNCVTTRCIRCIVRQMSFSCLADLQFVTSFQVYLQVQVLFQCVNNLKCIDQLCLGATRAVIGAVSVRGGGGGEYSCIWVLPSARRVSFQVKFKFIDLKRNLSEKYEYVNIPSPQF